jgi:glutathione S-transferase
MTADLPIVLGRRTSSNVQKVLWCLDELGQPFVREDYGGPFGRNRDLDYLRLNPNGVVPTLLDGKTVIWESNTICRYLCNRFGPTSLYPDEAGARACAEMWMDWQLAALNPVITPLYIALIRTSVEARDHTTIAVLAGRVAALFRVIDAALERHAFLAGEQLTLADLTLGMFAYRWRELGVARPALPRFNVWYDQLAVRPDFARHVAIGLT